LRISECGFQTSLALEIRNPKLPSTRVE